MIALTSTSNAGYYIFATDTGTRRGRIQCCRPNVGILTFNLLIQFNANSLADVDAIRIGGGGCIFKNNCRGEDKSFRSDGVDIEEVIKNKGWSVELGRSFVDKMLSDESGCV